MASTEPPTCRRTGARMIGSARAARPTARGTARSIVERKATRNASASACARPRRRRERAQARHQREVHDQQFGQPESQRVQPERDRPQHAPDEHVVDVAVHRHQRVDGAVGRAEAHEPSQVATAGAEPRAPGHDGPQRRREGRRGQVPQDDRGGAQAGDSEGDARDPAHEHVGHLGLGARAESIRFSASA